MQANENPLLKQILHMHKQYKLQLQQLQQQIKLQQQKQQQREIEGFPQQQQEQGEQKQKVHQERDRTKVVEVSKALKIRNEICGNYNTFFYATMCHVCKRFGDVPLKNCGGCKMIAYCSKQHQKQHWKQHKLLCKTIQNVLQDYSMEDCDVTWEEWDKMKLNLMLLVSLKLERRLEIYEMQMFEFPRECTVCHERNGQLLEDCQKCAAVSFCKNHKDNIKHRDICIPLKLCLHSYLLTFNKESNSPDLHYLQHVSYTDTFRDMNDFINTYGDIQTRSEMSYNIMAAKHSRHLTRPLTLFHAMRLLDYVPVGKTLVIHVIAANFFEETSLMAWEVLLHLIETVRSLVIILIGPELKNKLNSIPICDNCMSQKKKWSFEFHDELYENYVRSPLFVTPDIVVGFNACISVQELTSAEETWAPSIQALAKQNCPFVLTCYTQKELEDEIDRINIILNRKVDYLYSGKNPFTSLRPYRMLKPEEVFYSNHYLIVYKSLYS